MKLDVVKLRAFVKRQLYDLFKGGDIKCKGHENVTEEDYNLSFLKNVTL